MCSEQTRHSSTTTSSSRYKTDPVLRKHRFSTSDDSLTAQNSPRNSDLEIMDEENYLMPRNNQSTISSAGGKHSLVGKSIHEDDEDEENINAFITDSFVNGKVYIFINFLNKN